VKVELPRTDANLLDAAARGASEGLKLALNVGAMLLAFIALVATVNGLLGWVSGLVGLEDPITLELVLGWVGAPFAWLMGIAWADAPEVGALLGVKTILNEFVAYLQLAEMAGELSPRSLVITTYALCGFANLGSIGIQIGGISPLAPERRPDLARLALRALLGGTLAAFMTACVIGVIL
jgi:CNT family concentrative nucleoside transporter